MHIKVNDAQMQEYGAYMDSISGKLEAASTTVQSVISWMQNDEMLGENSRNRYFGKLKRAQRNLSHAADNARRFGPAIRQISENYQRNEQELMDELEQRVEAILSNPMYTTAGLAANNTPSHSDVLSEEDDEASTIYREGFIFQAKILKSPESLMSTKYLESVKSHFGMEELLNVWAKLHGDVKNAAKDPAMIRKYMLDNALSSMLEESGEKVDLYKGLSGFSGSFGALKKGVSSAVNAVERVVDAEVDLKNASLIVNTVDSQKMAQRAKIYMQSSDPDMRKVGEQLNIFATGTEAEKEKLIRDIYSVNTATEAAQGAAQTYSEVALGLNVETAIPMTAVKATDYLLGTDKTVEQINKIEFSNTTARELYDVVQKCVEKCEADPSPENMAELKESCLAYNGACAQAETAVVTQLETGKSRFLGQFTYSAEDKENIEQVKASAQERLNANSFVEDEYARYQEELGKNS